MQVVIKIGTGSVLAENGAALHPAMTYVAADIATLKNDGHQVILVCSGAVGKGRQVLGALSGPSVPEDLAHKQMLSGIGQPILMAAWNSLFLMHGKVGNQVLLTRAELQQKSPQEKLADNLRACEADPRVISIVNENDAIATDEFGFSDNDELASLLARQIKADWLIFLTGTNGILRDDPSKVANPGRYEVLRTSDDLSHLNGISAQGRGGVQSKIESARRAAAEGIATTVAAAHEEHVIRKVLARADVGTRFEL